MKLPWVQFNNYSFTYADRTEPALKDLNLTIYHGEKILILGENGSGKTSFLRALSNQLGVGQYEGMSSGEIIFHGDRIEQIDAEQVTDYFGDETTKASKHAVLKGRMQNLMPYKLEKESSSTEELSAGERDIYRFIEMVQAEQPVYIFDEPLANLAPQTSLRFIDILDDFHLQSKATIVVAEHRMEQMMYREIDRVIVLMSGRITFQGTLEHLLHTDVLEDLNVREPLYITAMRYAGYPLSQVQNISSVNFINGPELRETMENWLATIPSFRHERKSDPLLKLRGINYEFEQSQAQVHDINLTIHKGEMISVAGGNGAGKTTLSRLISGDLKPDAGEITWFTKAEDKHKVVYIPHDFKRLLTESTVEKQIQYILDQENYDEVKRNRLYQDSLKVTGLWFAREMPIRFLSYGQQKRLVLACALLKEPQLLLIDEPTEGQDYRHYIEFMSYLYRINQMQNIALVINSHDIELMLGYTRRTLVMQDCKIIADDRPVQIATNVELLKKGALSETSLAQFARAIGLLDPYRFIEKFMDYDREIKQVSSFGN